MRFTVLKTILILGVRKNEKSNHVYVCNDGKHNGVEIKTSSGLDSSWCFNHPKNPDVKKTMNDFLQRLVFLTDLDYQVNFYPGNIENMKSLKRFYKQKILSPSRSTLDGSQLREREQKANSGSLFSNYNTKGEKNNEVFYKG